MLYLYNRRLCLKNLDHNDPKHLSIQTLHGHIRVSICHASNPQVLLIVPAEVYKDDTGIISAYVWDYFHWVYEYLQ